MVRKVSCLLAWLLGSAGVIWAQETATVGKISVGGGLYDLGLTLGAGLSVGLACIGAGMALSNIGSSVVGAVTEKPELLGRLLIMLGLAEAIAIYGLVVAILLWVKM